LENRREKDAQAGGALRKANSQVSICRMPPVPGACLTYIPILLKRSRVFLEAMAVGLPVISYNKGGQSEFLLDDLTGALVPSGNSERLFEKIRQMVENEQLRQHISRHNLAYVENFFIEWCAQKYEEKYLSLIETAA
jgi:glycosyltransferase involved in cell wall biosynthesis